MSTCSAAALTCVTLHAAVCVSPCAFYKDTVLYLPHHWGSLSGCRRLRPPRAPGLLLSEWEAESQEGHSGVCFKTQVRHKRE